MINNTKVKIYASKLRHSINLPADFVSNSAFPFQVCEILKAKIEENKIVIEKDPEQ